MKRSLSFKYLPLFILTLLLCTTGFSACEDETSNIGSSITKGEVSIYIDSLTMDLNAIMIESDEFDSRGGNLLLGNLNVPEYGSLECSFVTRMMCAPQLNIPDSLNSPERVDSCKFIMLISRNDITGDSIAPQKVSLYLLDKQLPSDINNLFDPTGYYNPSTPLGTKSFVVSKVAQSDTMFLRRNFISIDIPLGKEFGQKIVEKYISDPTIFEWPQTFAQYIPGFYVKQTFGTGCVANINTAYIALYYHKKATNVTIINGDTTINVVNQRDSVLPFIVSPEVLSSNRVSYKVSESLREKVNQGEIILTTPSGFRTSFRFPAEELINRYKSMNTHLSTVGDLELSIPFEKVENSYQISNATTLLMIKTSELENFFAQNKTPDGLTSFTGTFNPATNQYNFSSLRSYFTGLLSKDKIEEEDLEFTILPVEISTEVVSNSYTGSGTTYVTKCVPYTSKPTLTKLLMDKALIVFTFSSQMID